jgi:purine-cytosine permease-like protein
MDGILKTLAGFSPVAAPYIYFVILQAAQTALAYRGIRAMKWFNVGGSIVITAVMIYMMAHILTKYGFQMQAQWNTPANWGAPFWMGSPPRSAFSRL